VFRGCELRSRPGEKLHEQLAYDAEQLNATSHPGIEMVVDRDHALLAGMDAHIERLDAARRSSSRREVIEAIAAPIPTMITSIFAAKNIR